MELTLSMPVLRPSPIPGTHFSANTTAEKSVGTRSTNQIEKGFASPTPFQRDTQAMLMTFL